jgi:threonine/homoserine/homoserine lactone efflux protein
LIIAILAGFLTGFFLAMPPGPVGVMAINMGVNKGSKAGTHLALGTGFMDFIFCVFAMSMATAVQAALGGFTDDYPNLYLFVQIAIIIALFIYGIFNVRKTDSQSGEVLQNPAEYSNSKIIRYLKNKGPFLLGIAIALTNIPNPTFLPSLTFIVSAVKSYALDHNLYDVNAISSLMFSIGFGLGNFAWLYTLVKIIIRYKDRMSPKLLSKIRQFTGFTFIGFGTFLGYKFLAQKGAEVLRLIFAL